MKVIYDLKNIKKIDAELKKLASKQLKVGVAGEVAEYANHNEFGTTHIPARPFFRSALLFGEAPDEILERVKEQIETIITGNNTADKVLNNIGLYCKGRVIKSIKNGNWIPNSKATLKKKGNKKPLIDSSKLIQSIEFEVINK